MAEQRKLWIDTDLGLDDALGVMLALSDHSVSLQGISTVFGNTNAKQVATNAGRICALCDRTDIPVFVGADEPLLRPRKPDPRWFGSDGLCDVPQARPRPSDVKPPADGSGAVELVKCAQENDGTLIVAALGPLSNLALACKIDPLFPSRVSKLVVMGSNGERGGVEFNFGRDPESADIVFRKFAAAAAPGTAQSNVVLVGMDCSEQHSLPWHMWDSVASKDTRKARFIGEISEKAVESAKAESPEGWVLADPLAVAVAIQPDIAATKQVSCKVEVQGSDQVAGMALLDETGPNRFVNLLVALDKSSFFASLLKSLD